MVHFPIVFAVSLPFVAAVALAAARRGMAVRPAWIGPVVVAAALFASAWLAVRTGEAQEDRVETVVAEAPLHDHEEAAESFLWLSGAGFIVFALGLARGRVGRYARYGATVSALLLVLAGYRVGASGGELVWEHGAARAYVQNATVPASAIAGNLRVAERHEREDERERDEREP